MHIVKEPGKRHGHWRLTARGEVRYDRAATVRRPVAPAPAAPEVSAKPAKVQRPPYPKDLAAEFTRILGAEGEKLVSAVYRNGEVHWADAMQFPQTLRTKQRPPQPDPEHGALNRAMGLLALYARYTLGDQLQGTRAMPVEAIRRIAAVYPDASDAMKPIERLRHPNTDFTDVAEILEGVKGRERLARTLIPILYPLDALPKREPIPVKPNALAGRDYPHEPGLDRLAERLATIRGVRPHEIDGMVREARAQVVLTISKPFASRANAVIDRWVELGYAPGAPGADLQAAADEWVAAHRDEAVPYGKEATEAARATIAAAHEAYRTSGATTFGAWVASLPHLPLGPDQATVTRETEARTKKGLGLIPAVHPDLHDKIKGQRVNVVGASHPAADYASRATYFKGDAQAARENQGYPASPHIVVFPESSPDVVAHEYGHHLGAALGVLPILRAWVLSRATGAPKKLGPPYDSTELAYPDTFAHRYVGATTISGRHYSENANTEVLSMGVQYLAIDADRFYQMDPDHALLTVGILQGMNPAAPKAKPLGKSANDGPPRNWPAEVPWRGYTPGGDDADASDFLDSPHWRVEHRGTATDDRGRTVHRMAILPGRLHPERHPATPGQSEGWHDTRVARANGELHDGWEEAEGFGEPDSWKDLGHKDGDLWRGLGHGGYKAFQQSGQLDTGHGMDAHNTGRATYYAASPSLAVGYAQHPTDGPNLPQFHRPRYLLHVRPPAGSATTIHESPSGSATSRIVSSASALPASSVRATYEVRPSAMWAGGIQVAEHPSGHHQIVSFTPPHVRTAIRKVDPAMIAKSQGDEAPPRNWPKKLPHLPLHEGLIASGASDFLDSPHWRVRYAGTEPSRHTGAEQHILHVVPRSLDPKRHKALPDAALENGSTVPSWYDSTVAHPPTRPGDEPQPHEGWQDSMRWDPGEYNQDMDLWRGLGHGGYHAFVQAGELATNSKGADAYGTGGATYYADHPHNALNYAENPTDPTTGAQFDRPRYLLHVKPPEDTEVKWLGHGYHAVSHALPASAVHQAYEVRPHVMRAGRLALRPIDTPEGKRYHVTHWAAPEADHVVGPVSAPIQKSVGEPVATQPPNWPAEVPWKPMHQFGYGKQAMAVLHDPGRKIVHHDSYKHGDATVHLFDIVPQGIDPARHTPDLEDPNDDPADAKVWYDHTMVTPTDQPHGMWRKWVPKDGWQDPHNLSTPEHQDGDLWRGVGHGGYRAMRETGAIRTEHKGDDTYNTGGATYYATGPHNAAVYADEPTDPLHNATFVRPRYLLHIRPPAGTQVTRHPDSGGYASVKDDLPASAVVGTHEVRPYKLHAGNFSVREHNGTFHVTDFNDMHGVNFVKKVDPPPAAALAKGWYGEENDKAPRNWPSDLPWKPLGPRGYAGNDIMRSLNSPHHRVEYVGTRETSLGKTAHDFRILPGEIDPARHKEFPHEPGRFYDSEIATPPGNGILPNHKPRDGWQTLEDFAPQGHEDGDLWRGIGHEGYKAFQAEGALRTSHKGGDRYGSGGATYYGTTPDGAASYASNSADFLAHAQFHRPRYLLHVRPPAGTDVRHHESGKIATVSTPIPASAVKATYEVRPYAMRSGNFTVYEESDGTYHPADYNDPSVQNAIKKVEPSPVTKSRYDETAEEQPRNWPSDLPWKPFKGYGGVGHDIMRVLNSPHHRVEYTGSTERYDGTTAHNFRVLPGEMDPTRHLPFPDDPNRFYDRKISTPPGDGYFANHKPRGGWQDAEDYDLKGHEAGDLWRGIGHEGYKAFRAEGALRTNRKGYDHYDTGGATYYGTQPYNAASYASEPTDALNHTQFHRPRYLLHVRPPAGTQVTTHGSGTVATVDHDLPESAVQATYEVRPYALRAGDFTLHEQPDDSYHADRYAGISVQNAIKKVKPPKLATLGTLGKSAATDDPADEAQPAGWPAGLPWKGVHWGGYRDSAMAYLNSPHWRIQHRGTREDAEGQREHVFDIMPGHLDPERHVPLDPSKRMWYDREVAQTGSGNTDGYSVAPAHGWEHTSRFYPEDHREGDLWRGIGHGGHKALLASGELQSSHKGGDNYEAGKGQTYYGTDHDAAMYYAEYPTEATNLPQFHRPRYLLHVRPPEGATTTVHDKKQAIATVGGAMPLSAIKHTYELRPYAMKAGSFTLRETPEGPYRATEARSPESYTAIKRVGGSHPEGLAKSFQAPPPPSMDLPINGDHPNWPTGLPKTVRLDPGYSILANHMKTGTTRLSAADATQKNEEYYGPGHRWRINVDPHIDPALHGVVPGREPDSADPYVSGKAQWYDRELAEAKPDDDWNGMGLGERHHAVPIVGKAEGWHDQIPAEEGGGYLYRGMSAGELRHIAASGGIASRGEHNIGDVQQGLTYFADNPHSAASYATGFAPSGYKPTFGHPGYVVKIKHPGDDRVVRLPHIMEEAGVKGAIPHDQIESVYEARPYAVERGQHEIVSDGRTKDPVHLDGSGKGATSRVLWREAHPSEFFGGPKPIQKSGDAATDPQRLARTPWPGDRVTVNAPGRREHGDTFTVGKVSKTGVVLHDAAGTPAISVGASAWHQRVTAGQYAHTAPGIKPRRAGADFTPQAPAPKPPPSDPTDASLSAILGRPATAAGLRAAYEQGGRAGNVRVSGGDRAVSVLGEVHDGQGNRVGKFDHAIVRGPHGPTVINNTLDVDRGTQGRGHGTAFADHAERVWADHGVREVKVKTLDSGKYAWAKQGYGWNDPSDRHSTLHDLDQWLQAEGHPRLTEAQRDALVTPADVAKFDTGRTHRVATKNVQGDYPAGKAFLLSDYAPIGWFGSKTLGKSDGPESFEQFQAKPLVHTVGENHDGVFFHGTHKANVKTLAQPVPAGGFKREVSGRGLFGRGINEFGADVFLSDKERPHQALGFASGPGQALARVKLRDGSRILDLSDEATRTGIVNPGGPRVLKFFRRPAMTDDLLAHVREHAPAVLREHPGFERQMQAIDPGHPSFDPETWRSTLMPYLRDRGYAAVRLADETLVPDRSAIEHVRHATPEERAALEAQHATYMGGPGFAKEPTGAYRKAWEMRQGLAKSGDVREPGKRGGKFWRDGKGKVRYGKQPGLHLGLGREDLFGANQLTPKEDLKAIPAQVRAAVGHLYGDDSGLGRNFAGDTYARVELADRNKTRLFEALVADIKRAGQHPDGPPSYADSAFRGMLDQVNLLYDPEEYRVNHTNPGESEMWTAPFQEKHDQLVAIVRRALYDDPAALVEAGKKLLASGRTPAEAAPGSAVAEHRQRIKATVAAARDEFATVGKGSPARWLAMTRHDEADWADKWVRMSRMDEEEIEKINYGLAMIPLAKHYLAALEGSERPAIAWDHYNRSHYDPKQRMVKLDDNWSEDVVAHEYGHHLERQLGLGPILTTWVQDRATGEPQPLGQPYRSGEQAYPDRFYNRYIGKVYGEVEGQQTTEVLSMGLHALAVDPQAFYEADPEHFFLTMGLLQGLGGGGVAKSEDVKEPGKRGGKFWRDKLGRVRYGKEPSWRGPTPQEAPQASLTAGPSYSVVQPHGNLAPPLPAEALSPKARKAIRDAYNDIGTVWTYPDYKNDTERKAKIAELIAACERDVMDHWQKHDPSDPNQASRLRHAEVVIKHFTRYALGNNYKLTDGDVMDRARALAAAVVPEVFSPKGYAATAKRRAALLAKNPVEAHTGYGVRTPEAREILLSRLNAILPERQWDGNRAYLLVDDALKAWGQRIATGKGWREEGWKAWRQHFVYSPRDKKTDAGLSMARWQASPDRDHEPDAWEGERAEKRLREVFDGWADAMDAAADRHVAAHVANVYEVIDRARQAFEGEAKGDPARFVSLYQPRSPKVAGKKAVEISVSTFAGKDVLLDDSIRAVGLIPMSPQVRAKVLAYGKPPMRWTTKRDDPEERSHYNGDINLVDEEYPQVAAHEYGHHIERALGAAPVLTRWIRHRAQGPAIHLGNGYMAKEKAYPDAFIGRYVGKEYGGAYVTTDGSTIETQSSSTEVLSMGVEALITEPENFYKTDPEHYLLTMGVLLGHADDLPYVRDETFEEERAVIRERAARSREYRAARGVEKSREVRDPGSRGSTRWWRTPAGQVRYGERPSAPVGGLPMTETEREGHTKDLIQPWDNLTPPTAYGAIPPKVERAINRLFQVPTALRVADPEMCRSFKNFAMQMLLGATEGYRDPERARTEFRRNIETTMNAFDDERWAKARPGWTRERAIQELCDVADAEVYGKLPEMRKRIERARKPDQPRHSRPVSRDDRGLWDKLDEIAVRHLGLAGVAMTRENTDAFMACRMIATRGMGAWEDAQKWADQHAVDAATGAGYRALYADPTQDDARGEALRFATGITKDRMMPILHAIYSEWAGWVEKGDKTIREGQRRRRAKLVAAARKRCEKETGGDLAAFVGKYALGEQGAYQLVAAGMDPAGAIESAEWPTLVGGIAAVPLGPEVIDLLGRRNRPQVRRGDTPRSSYSPGRNPRLNMSVGFTADVAAHEFAHHVEQVCGWGEIVRPWVLDRAEGPTQPLGYRYEKDEVAYPDHFMNRYVGKEYGERHGSTEVISVGVQALVLDPVAFERADAEHCWLTLALLLGLGMDDITKSFDPAGGHPDQRPQASPEEADANLHRWSAGSVLNHPSGHPMTFYHGTPRAFTSFDPRRMGENTHIADAREGFFFGATPEIADHYTNFLGRNKRDATPNIMPVHLNAKRLLYTSLGHSLPATQIRAAIRMAHKHGCEGVAILSHYPEEAPLGGGRHVGNIRQRGGAIPCYVADAPEHVPWSGEKGWNGDSVAVFHPHQIKSAVGNNGHYDPTDPHLGKSEDVQEPGSRGGKFWRDRRGHVRYGDQPVQAMPGRVAVLFRKDNLKPTPPLGLLPPKLVEQMRELAGFGPEGERIARVVSHSLGEAVGPDDWAFFAHEWARGLREFQERAIDPGEEMEEDREHRAALTDTVERAIRALRKKHDPTTTQAKLADLQAKASPRGQVDFTEADQQRDAIVAAARAAFEEESSGGGNAFTWVERHALGEESARRLLRFPATGGLDEATQAAVVAAVAAIPVGSAVLERLLRSGETCAYVRGPRDRSDYDHRQRAVNLGSAMPDVIAHEFGHFIEKVLGWGEPLHDWVAGRAAGSPVSLGEDYGNERAYPDSFINKYVGKTYHGSQGTATEALSVGVQALHVSAGAFRAMDREHFMLTMGLLLGLGPDPRPIPR